MTLRKVPVFLLVAGPILAAVSGSLLFPARPRPTQAQPTPRPPLPFDLSDLDRNESPPRVQTVQGTLPLVPPKKMGEIFPCMRCHKDFKPLPTPRVLSFEHERIKVVRGGDRPWCYDCHNPPNQDYLRLSDGELIPFGDSYRLCGQCHGEKLRDWRAGAHGKRVGGWGIGHQLVTCVRCHDPHLLKFKPVRPLPPPAPPKE